MITRLNGNDMLQSSLHESVEDLMIFLGKDIPELIQAVRDSNEAVLQARRDLAARAGMKYRLVITSDSPLGVGEIQASARMKASLRRARKEKRMPVEPVTLYKAYCDLNYPEHTHDDDGTVEGCPGCFGTCEWEWICDRYGDSGDCEIQLCAHMRKVHGVDRPLPHGYEYRQAGLERALSE